MRAPNLVLHCGAHSVERTALEGIVLPPATDTYFPVGHTTVVNMVEDRLNEIGFRFAVEAHSLTKEGQRYFGLIQLVNGTQSEEHALVVGIRNSIDKSFPAALAFGSQVFVCDNLAFTGEIKISRKHTTHIMRDLPDLITKAVAQTTLMRRNQERRFEFWKEVVLPDYTAEHLIIEMVRREVINTQRVIKVVREWDEPSHDFGGRTAWRMFNAVTESLKGSYIQDMPPRTIRLQGMLDEITGFVPEAPAITAADWQG